MIDISYEDGDPIAFAAECLNALEEHSGVTVRKYKYAFQFTENPEAILSLLWTSLARGNRDASILDPTGHKSTPEMEGEIRKAADGYFIENAREYFKALQDGTAACLRGELEGKAVTDDPELIVGVIRGCLARAHADAAALDPSGRKTAAEMEQEIKTGVVPQQGLSNSDKQKHIAEARLWLGILRNGVGDTDEALRVIRRDLTRAGVDASELDPEHRRSAAQMEQALRDAYKQGNLNIAKGNDNFIRTDDKEGRKGLTPWDANARDTVRQWSIENMNAALKKADAGTEALNNVTGDSSIPGRGATGAKPPPPKTMLRGS